MPDITALGVSRIDHISQSCGEHQFLAEHVLLALRKNIRERCIRRRGFENLRRVSEGSEPRFDFGQGSIANERTHSPLALGSEFNRSQENIFVMPEAIASKFPGDVVLKRLAEINIQFIVEKFANHGRREIPGDAIVVFDVGIFEKNALVVLADFRDEMLFDRLDGDAVLLRPCAFLSRREPHYWRRRSVDGNMATRW